MTISDNTDENFRQRACPSYVALHSQQHASWTLRPVKRVSGSYLFFLVQAPGKHLLNKSENTGFDINPGWDFECVLALTLSGSVLSPLRTCITLIKVSQRQCVRKPLWVQLVFLFLAVAFISMVVKYQL